VIVTGWEEATRLWYVALTAPSRRFTVFNKSNGEGFPIEKPGSKRKLPKEL
jgi:hypothetical protein